MNYPVVTVFGGTGFLGREICRHLVDEGWRVRIAARRPDIPLSGVPADFSERVTVDIGDPAAVADALTGAAAAVNAVSLYVQRPRLRFRDIHVKGAGRIADSAREQGVNRLIHISGIGVDSHSPSAYVRQRALGENAVRRAFPRATVLRPSVLFGPGDSFLSTLEKLARLPLAPLFGKGRTRLQPVHVGDVAEAVASALHRPDSAGEIYELGGADTLTYREILETLMAERGTWRRPVPVPFALWHLAAAVLSPLPGAPLTRDQVWLMQRDNVADPALPGLEELGIEARGLPLPSRSTRKEESSP